MKLKYYIFIILLISIASCKPEIDEFDANKGSADFSTYLSVGNSLTAGFADGALYTSGQEYSYPNILAEQFKSLGGGEFNQPMMPDDLGVGISGTAEGAPLNTKYVLGYSTDCTGATSLAPVLADPNKSQLELATELTTSIALEGPFNNIGVPAVRSIDLLVPGYGMLNKYYGRFAQSPATDKIIDEASRIPYTFFTLWVGSNDVLGYALAGGEADPNNPLAVITDLPTFSAAMDAVVNILTAQGAAGAIANVPDITSIPFFTTVAYNALVLDQQNADLLNQGYAPYNAAIDQYQLPIPKIEFSPGNNAFIIADTNFPYSLLGGLRQILPNELILMSVPQDSLKCGGWGTQVPIPMEYTLDYEEIAKIELAVKGYNQKIEDLANLYPLALVDVNKYYRLVDQQGVVLDGVEFSSTFVQGNVFSTDGIHLCAQGNALVAYYFIEAINQTFGASIPQVNVTNYPAVQYP